MRAMKRFLVFALLALGAGMAHAKTCLVLSGGGARGIAHVGVLKVLERERVKIDCIVGTSMGAVVGGAYASGRSVDELEALVKSANWNAILADRPARERLAIRRRQRELLGECRRQRLGLSPR